MAETSKTATRTRTRKKTTGASKEAPVTPKHRVTKTPSGLVIIEH